MEDTLVIVQSLSNNFIHNFISKITINKIILIYKYKLTNHHVACISHEAKLYE